MASFSPCPATRSERGKLGLGCGIIRDKALFDGAGQRLAQQATDSLYQLEGIALVQNPLVE